MNQLTIILLISLFFNNLINASDGEQTIELYYKVEFTPLRCNWQVVVKDQAEEVIKALEEGCDQGIITSVVKQDPVCFTLSNTKGDSEAFLASWNNHKPKGFLAKIGTLTDTFRTYNIAIAVFKSEEEEEKILKRISTPTHPLNTSQDDSSDEMEEKVFKITIPDGEINPFIQSTLGIEITRKATSSEG